MNIFYRILFCVIAVCVPVVTILSGFNIVFRMPDLYVYEFNKNQTTKEVELGITNDELGEFFSDYMMGKEKELNLLVEYRDRERPVFGAVEKLNMENARELLNNSLFVLGGALILGVAGCGVFLAKKKKYELRGAFKAGILVQTLALIACSFALYFDQPRSFLYHKICTSAFGADDVLPLMLTKEYAQLSVAAASAVSIVLLVILVSVVWRLTKPRRMFYN